MSPLRCIYTSRVFYSGFTNWNMFCWSMHAIKNVEGKLSVIQEAYLLMKCPFFIQMSQLWWRVKRLSERLENDSPSGLTLGSPATTAPQGSNTSWVPKTPVVTPDEPIFLMTSTAQTISGFFVWTALLITCHQVSRVVKWSAGLNEMFH